MSIREGPEEVASIVNEDRSSLGPLVPACGACLDGPGDVPTFRLRPAFTAGYSVRCSLCSEAVPASSALLVREAEAIACLCSRSLQRIATKAAVDAANDPGARPIAGCSSTGAADGAEVGSSAPGAPVLGPSGGPRLKG